MDELPPGSFDYSVSLRIWHPKLTRDAISEALALEPHAGWDVGTPVQLLGKNSSTRTRTRTYWSSRLPVEASTPLAESLRRGCTTLEPYSEFLHAIVETGGRAELYVGWFSGPTSGEVFPRSLLQTIAGLGMDLTLEVYSQALAARGEAHL